jgi:tetratricopeptide (TPR) repeat protein
MKHCILILGCSLSFAIGCGHTPSEAPHSSINKRTCDHVPTSKVAANSLAAPGDNCASIGEALRNDDRLEEALVAYSKAIDLEPKNIDYHIARIGLLCDLRRFDDALDEANQCINEGLEPKVRLFVEVSRVYGLSGDNSKYMEWLSKAIELDPHNDSLLERRADAYANVNCYTEAIADYSEALRHTRMLSYELTLKRAGIYSKVGNYRAAIMDIREATNVQPPRAEPYALLAMYLATVPDNELRDGAQALQCAQLSFRIARPSELVLAERALAASYAELGSFDKAIEHQEKAISHIESEIPIEVLEQLNCYKSREPWRIGVKHSSRDPA